VVDRKRAKGLWRQVRAEIRPTQRTVRFSSCPKDPIDPARRTGAAAGAATAAATMGVLVSDLAPGPAGR
jgi:hypothetical protein